MPEQAPWRFQKILQPMFSIPAPRRILRGRILTAVGDQVIEDGYLDIQNGKIAAIGPVTDMPKDSDAEIIDAKGGTILPGIIQSHAHLAWDGVHDLAQQSMSDSPEISAYKSAGNMLKCLRAGITTFRDLGMNTSNLFAKQAVEQGIFPGPRLLVCGQAIVQTGGHTYWCCREASGADEMRRAVREQVRGGADLIKIMASHDLVEFTDEELHAVIDETHRNGLPITAHATFDEVIYRVAKFGVDVIEHGGSMRGETIQLLLEKNIPIVTTFAPLIMQADEVRARQYNIPEWKIAERKRQIADPSRYQGLIDAAKAGVVIAFGTDAGSPVVPHDVVAPELKFMVKLGVVDGNYGAIRSATIIPARIHKLDKKIGTLEVGKEADVIIVQGNPLDDLDALEHVTYTFVAGKKMYTA
jgi:imidazolonepropionase-like amidohydrolase